MLLIETRWRDAEEGERRSRARFAQNAIKPEEVAPEWRRWRELLGGPDEVRQFVERAMSRLDAPLEPQPARAGTFGRTTAPSERLASRGMEGSIRLVFEEPAPAARNVVVRSHPLPATLAEALLEGALDPDRVPCRLDEPVLGRPRRKGADNRCHPSLALQAHGSRTAGTAAARGGGGAIAFGPDEAPFHRRRGPDSSGSGGGWQSCRGCAQPVGGPGRQRIEPLRRDDRGVCARAGTGVGQDHARVRAAGVNVPRVTVEPVQPADIVGLFVLTPGGV